ncbi:MAG: hypothetical protein LBP78_05300 [Acidaminococcales bacterium]|jgi:4-hydroxybutyrate CoA-transferase|nr:hypothetical protein [Acidaminococcales bacterium]
MSWENNYKNKIVSADEAVKIIKSGDRVLIGHATGEPSVLVEALVKRAPELRNVELMHMVCMGKARYCQEDMKDSFAYSGPFLGNGTREAVASGRADYWPCFMHEIPKMITTRKIMDVALIMVSPPDEKGECSFGVSVDYTESAARTPQTKIILQVNNRMPYTYGTTINLNRAHYIVKADQEVIELPDPKISEVEEKIGRNIAALVNDGDTIQMGIGSMPDAVLNFLGDRKHLGVHSELVSDGMRKLAEKGVIDNSRKTLHQGKFVANFFMGTRKLYDFIDKNKDILAKPCDYTNDPFVIAQNDNMVAINATMQVDLYGQMNSNSIGVYQYSGVGGQVDFIRGTNASKGGRSIIALPSTAKGGSISKIVCFLDYGSAVTTSRYDSRFIVTEYGAVDLFGLNLRQRVKALISIAHPAFREQLEKEAWEKKMLR